MDKKSILEIGEALRVLAKKYPDIMLCIVMAQPCAEHNGAHLDLASAGVEPLCGMIDAAILAFDPASMMPTEKMTVQ